jgi:hypothetical protein
MMWKQAAAALQLASRHVAALLLMCVCCTSPAGCSRIMHAESN